ncbi:Zinc-type alcohol dehydrogenase-like protein [Botrimarina colliarenosi]|uniref:Zinc-type alcohol dehydrogenase-like protein n=1 Tax=Botrimarina colliarenosi TaxID=2528001 RepID=A0A5C6ABP5_9BACT|nr:NADPH:quinone reductase [Botrimarina colliarenosi]TWT96797.1 Zinc-type alcohol dehydrogenase-like protein [Botrimarina colliarenosi]
MKAAYVTQPGPADTLTFGELPTPTPGPGECLVRVAVSAVNPIDTYVRGGIVAMELPSPYVPGCDLAGVVDSVGDGVTQFQPGDRVWGSNQGLLGRQGTLAEFAAVGQEWLYPTPDGVSDEAAAAGALVGITAHLGLVREAQLKAGETILVVGGSGGVGSTVVQLAKALGARVITTAGCEERAVVAREAGADEVILYKQEDIGEATKRLAPSGVNVWWETRREPDLAQVVGCLAERGRMVVMAGRDATPALPIGPFYVKGCRLLGFAMFKATPEEQHAAADDLNRWLASGAYQPRIARTFSLDETAAAHALQEAATIARTETLAGKIVVKI